MLGIQVFEHGPTRIYNVLSHCGQIIIGDFKENVFMPVEYWSLNDYKQQWKEAIERIKSGHEKSCLVTKIYDPKKNKFIELWSLYKRGDKVHIFNNLLAGDWYDEVIGKKEYTLETCYDFVSDYSSHDEDGMKISEWIVPINQLDIPLPSEQVDCCSCEVLGFDKEDYGDQVFYKENASIIHNEFSEPGEDNFWYKFIERRRVGVFSLNLQEKCGK